MWEWGLRLDHVFYDAKKYYYKSVLEERNYDVLFNEFETGTDFANQILVNPKFNFKCFRANWYFKKLSDNSEFNISYILSQRAPNPSELFSDGLHHAMAAIEYGNLSIT